MKNRSILRSLAVVLVVLGGSLASAQHQADPSIVREGEGPRRGQLNKMELAPFPADAWSLLSDWKHGAAPAADGKVVLICTYADWYPSAKRGFALAQRLAQTKAKDGLIVVAVHHKDGWDAAAKGDSSVILAHDAQGKFRERLLVDQDPDFYFIDRSGQLRYADVATESVEQAVDLLLAEKADAAAGLKGRLADEAQARDLELRRIDAMRDQVDLTSIPELPFPEPSPEAIKAAKWPPLPRDPSAQQGQATLLEPKPVALPDTNWFPRKPELKGRAVLLYLWHPDLPGSFHGIMHNADLLQRQYGRDLVVVGVLSPLSTSINNQQLTEDQRDPVKLQKKLEEVAKSRKFDHFLTIDPGNAIFDALQNQQNVIPWPFFVIVSSDKMARWWPVVSQGGQTVVAGVDPIAALLQVLKVDPGVQARRAVEAEWIRTQQK
ncbi:MAG: hypothetical protein HUU18_04805 [Phycisphaerales bacterium]|nr:hypothetical protein [Phycisphaerales bacterium]